MIDLNKKNELKKSRIKEELSKLKGFKAKCKRRLTIARLKTMNGFENLTDELAEQTIKQLEEYAKIVLAQMNRLSKLGQNVVDIKK
jgi:hypothetical protein